MEYNYKLFIMIVIIENTRLKKWIKGAYVMDECIFRIFKELIKEF
jgi:hypothetical protein